MNWFLVAVKTYKPCPQNGLLVSLRSSFQNLRCASPSYLHVHGSPATTVSMPWNNKSFVTHPNWKEVWYLWLCFWTSFKTFQWQWKITNWNKTVISTAITCNMCVLYDKCVAVLCNHQIKLMRNDQKSAYCKHRRISVPFCLKFSYQISVTSSHSTGKLFFKKINMYTEYIVRFF